MSLLDPRLARLCPDLFLGSAENLWLAAGPGFGKSEKWNLQTSARSDTQGNFEFPAGEAGASAVLLVTAQGFAAHLALLQTGLSQKIVLEPGAEMKIRVFDAARKAGQKAVATLVPEEICGAIVQALPEYFVWRQEADSDGWVDFHNLPRGAYALRVTDDRRVFGVQPLVTLSQRTELRVDALWTSQGLRGRVERPSHVAGTSGSVVAFWKDPVLGVQWLETPYSDEDGSFELNAAVAEGSALFLARSASGLSSPATPLADLGHSRGSLQIPLRLRFPTSWQGRLGEGVTVTSLVVQFLLPGDFPANLGMDSLDVPVGTDRRFVIPEVSPLAQGARLIAPGYGAAEIRFDEKGEGDLGQVDFKPGPTLQGRAVWDDASPMQGGVVEILSASGSICKARASREGNFACSPEAPVQGELRYRARVGSAEFRLMPRSGNDDSTLVADPGIPISITVTRPGGRGRIEDLRLVIDSVSTAGKSSASRQPFLYARSPGGRLSFHVTDSRRFRLTLENPEGSPSVSKPVDPASEAANKKLALTLPQGPAVFGTVAAAAGGRPIGGAQVEIASDAPTPGEVRITRVTHTATDGAWRQEGVAEGGYRLLASATGYASAGKRISVPSESILSQQLLLQSPGGIHGRVFGLPEGVSASVRAYPMNQDIDRSDYRGEVSSQGEFSFDSVRPDRYDVSLIVKRPGPAKQRSNFATRSITAVVKPGEITEAIIDLRKSVTLSGEADLGSKPLENADLIFMRSSRGGRGSMDRLTTDAQGHYQVSLPGPGTYGVMYLLHGGEMGDRMLSLDQALVVGEDERETRDLKFSDGRIRGRLVNSAGKPVADAFVQLLSDAPEYGVPEDEDPGFKQMDSVHSREDGTFELGPLPAAKYRLRTGQRSMTHEVGPVSLGHDQMADLQDIVLAADTAIDCVALSPAGEPLDGADVYAYRGGLSLDSAAGYAWAKTSDKGTARLEELAPGSYMVVGMMAGLAPAILEEVEVPRKEPAAPLVLQLASGGSLDVHIRTPKGEPVPYTLPRIIDTGGRDVTRIYMMRAAVTAEGGASDSEGRVRFDGILPGEYLIQASAGGKADERRVTITTGKTATVKLSIEVVDDE